jgi:cytosine/adenosine deaminase-related metal-dependent hydrolase
VCVPDRALRAAGSGASSPGGTTLTEQILIRGGRVLTMVPGSAELRADILVRGEHIVEIAPDLHCPDATVIEARDGIVLPGFVDTHRHVWQTQLRTVATDWSLFDYFTQMRLLYSAFYEPDDVFLGNHVGALEALDAGVTTVVDHCHILHTPEHTDEAVRGLQESGIRALFCYGLFESPSYRDEPKRTSLPAGWRRDDARRVRRDLLASEDARVVMGFAPTEIDANPYETNVAEIGFARELTARRISCHVAMGAYDSGQRIVERLGRDGLLAEDMLFVHGSSLTDDELRRMADSGAAVSATPETEMQMGMGFPVALRARDAGVRSSLGVDIVSNYSGDMFAQMRLCLQASRALDNRDYESRGRAPRSIRLKARDVLDLATRGGAEAAGLGSRVGTLETGKQADIVLIRTDAIHMTPAIDAVGAVVLNANSGDVDTVMVAGRVVKKDGRLVGVDWPALSARLHASSRRIIEGMQSVSLPMIEEMAAQMMPRVE